MRSDIGLNPSKVFSDLYNIKAGQSVVYHIGDLAGDRMSVYNNTGQVAGLAMNLFEQGRVRLFQRRLGPPVYSGVIDWKFGAGPGFEYIAVGI